MLGDARDFNNIETRAVINLSAPYRICTKLLFYVHALEKEEFEYTNFVKFTL